MLEHAIYSGRSPEARVLDPVAGRDRAQDAATSMKITAQDLLSFGVIDLTERTLRRRSSRFGCHDRHHRRRHRTVAERPAQPRFRDDPPATAAEIPRYWPETGLMPAFLRDLTVEPALPAPARTAGRRPQLFPESAILAPIRLFSMNVFNRFLVQCPGSVPASPWLCLGRRALEGLLRSGLEGPPGPPSKGSKGRRARAASGPWRSCRQPASPLMRSRSARNVSV